MADASRPIDEFCIEALLYAIKACRQERISYDRAERIGRQIAKDLAGLSDEQLDEMIKREVPRRLDRRCPSRNTEAA